MTQDRVKQAKLKAAKYCAFAERSPRQVRDKLIRYGLDPSQAEITLSELRNEGFVDESRFASAFVHDKFEFNKWGRNKLRYELTTHDIPERVVEKALNRISGKQYLDTIKKLLIEKWGKIPQATQFLNRKKKTIDFVVRKGFEFQEVRRCFDEIMSDREQ